MTANLICESPAPTIRVARFLRPDLRPALHAGAIADLPEGGTLILNFGLVDWFPTVFYSLLLQTLHDLRAKHARLVLCCLTANVKEGFDLMGGGKLFAVHGTEAKAIAGAKK